MKILKIGNCREINELVLISNNSCTRVLIRFSDDRNFCFSAGNGVVLKTNENDKRVLEIRNTDKSVYEVFDKLYNSLLSIKDENKEYFDKDDNFICFSNSDKKESSDYLVINHDLDSYRLIFVRNNSHKESVKKTIRSINIDFSEPKTNDIMRCFLEMYKGLKKIGTTELLLTRKDDKNE